MTFSGVVAGRRNKLNQITELTCERTRTDDERYTRLERIDYNFCFRHPIWKSQGITRVSETLSVQASLPDDNRALVPPDPIPNSEVKRCIADGSVGFPHVRVGHRQASNPKPRLCEQAGFFLWLKFYQKKSELFTRTPMPYRELWPSKEVWKGNASAADQ